MKTIEPTILLREHFNISVCHKLDLIAKDGFKLTDSYFSFEFPKHLLN